MWRHYDVGQVHRGCGVGADSFNLFISRCIVQSLAHGFDSPVFDGGKPSVWPGIMARTDKWLTRGDIA